MNQLARLLSLVGLVALLVGFTDTGTAWGQAVTPLGASLVSREAPEWRPIPNSTEALPGNSHRFFVRWTQFPPPAGVMHFLRVRILSSTQYPGVASNYGESVGNDFSIIAEDNANWNVTADGRSATTAVAVAVDTDVPLQVGAFDGAGKMTIQAYIFDPGPPAAELGATIPQGFPIDNNGNDLPDAWEQANEVTNPDLDEDDTPTVDVTSSRPNEAPGSLTGMGVTGDGLTNWEEYRGFIVARQFESTKPKIKDLFYMSFHTRNVAIKVFENIWRLQNEATPKEVNSLTGMVINYNNSGLHGSTPQRALRLEPGSGAPPGLLGEARLRSGGPGQGRQFIHTGASGICDTTAAAGDLQVVPVDRGAPDVPYITLGLRQRNLASTPAGDDEIIAGTFITTGENGIAETARVAPDEYIEVIPTGQGAPNRLCVDPGADDTLTSIPNSARGSGGDDAPGATDPDAEENVALTPNETEKLLIYDSRIAEVAVLGKPSNDRAVAERTAALTDAVIAHEMGHGVHVAHYLATNDQERRKASVMVLAGTLTEEDGSIPKHLIPKKYDATDFGQRRLHIKHR